VCDKTDNAVSNVLVDGFHDGLTNLGGLERFPEVPGYYQCHRMFVTAMYDRGSPVWRSS
jgi:hypothetical protein